MNVKKNITKTKKGKISEVPFKPCVEFTMEIIKENDPRKWKVIADAQRKRYTVENIDLECSPEDTLVSVIGVQGLKNLTEQYVYRNLTKETTLAEYCTMKQEQYMNSNVSCGSDNFENREIDRIYHWWYNNIYSEIDRFTYFPYAARADLFAFFDNLVVNYEKNIRPVLKALKPAIELFEANLKSEMPGFIYANGMVFMDGKNIPITDLLKFIK